MPGGGITIDKERMCPRPCGRGLLIRFARLNLHPQCVEALFAVAFRLPAL